MEEKREPLSEMAIERKIQILRNKHMDSEVIALDRLQLTGQIF